MSKWKLKHCAPDLCFLRSHISHSRASHSGDRVKTKVAQLSDSVVSLDRGGVSVPDPPASRPWMDERLEIIN